MNNIKTETIVRTTCLALALINQILSSTGHSILPITDQQIELLTSTGLTVIMAVWAWWKNNSFTRAAIIGDKAMEAEKIREAGEFND